jgi:acyl-CoA reductase-like NAD-dependent aldehyde dehydrogenase
MGTGHRVYGQVKGGARKSIFNPWNGTQVAQVVLDGADELETLIAGASAAFRSFKKLSRWARAELLWGISDAIGERAEEFSALITEEAGKPISAARLEVTRAQATFRWSAEEVRRWGGEIQPLDGDASGRAFDPAQAMWFPRGPVLAITPFNFPLNLVAHKVAPALAAGCPVLLKPSPQAPGASYLLHEVFLSEVAKFNSKLGKGAADQNDRVDERAFQIFFAENAVTGAAIRDSRVPTVSFTGSDSVGWSIRNQAERKKVCLELGGDAAVIVDEDADLARAADRIAWGAFSYAGQVCISVQRVLVHESIADSFMEKFLSRTRALAVGDPSDPATVVGPVIDEGAAQRVQEWIKEAVDAGATVHLQGRTLGRVIEPWILSDAPASCRLSSNEVFGPVALVQRFRTLQEAHQQVNASRFGLQAGIFTRSPQAARQTWSELEVGGLIINDVPTFRADPMPYGGVKDSGLGREGVRFAMEEFSERRVCVAWTG